MMKKFGIFIKKIIWYVRKDEEQKQNLFGKRMKLTIKMEQSL